MWFNRNIVCLKMELKNTTKGDYNHHFICDIGNMPSSVNIYKKRNKLKETLPQC